MNNETLKKYYNYLNKFLKLVSTAVIVILLGVGVLLVYYLVDAKKDAKHVSIPKYSLYTIISGSMEPKLKVYDIIVDKRVDNLDEIKIGDVITFTSTSRNSINKTVTHRVMDIINVNGEQEFVTKGDANQTADSDTVRKENLIGKTVLRLPKLGWIQIFLMQKLGWVLVVLLPSITLILLDLYKLFDVTIAKGSSDNIEVDSSLEKEEDKLLNQVMEKIYKI